MILAPSTSALPAFFSCQRTKKEKAASLRPFRFLTTALPSSASTAATTRVAAMTASRTATAATAPAPVSITAASRTPVPTALRTRRARFNGCDYPIHTIEIRLIIIKVGAALDHSRW